MTVRSCIVSSTGHRYLSSLPTPGDLANSDNELVWIDTDTTERSDDITAFLEGTLGIHPLVVEDMYSSYENPKIEDYGQYLYLVMHGVLANAQSPQNIDTTELDIVFGRNWIFTQHHESMRSVQEMVDEVERNDRLLHRGTAFVAYSLIDRMTDHYMPVVDQFDEEIDGMERAALRQADSALMTQLFGIKRSLQKLRRISLHHRDLLQRISRGEFDLVPTATLPFFRDVYDHFVRICDLVDNHREMVTTVMEMHVSVTANRTNDIMKVLAMISTIMLPLTFIAGVYGMNFARMPELKWTWGYPGALGLMAVIALVLVYYFKRKKWF